jgi:hypothetical protein
MICWIKKIIDKKKNGKRIAQNIRSCFYDLINDCYFNDQSVKGFYVMVRKNKQSAISQINKFDKLGKCFIFHPEDDVHIIFVEAPEWLTFSHDNINGLLSKSHTYDDFLIAHLMGNGRYDLIESFRHSKYIGGECTVRHHSPFLQTSINKG